MNVAHVYTMKTIELVLLVGCLLCKNEDWSPIPSSHMKTRQSRVQV